MWEHSEKAKIFKPGSGLLPEPNNVGGTLILDFQPSELWDINLLFKKKD